MAITGDDKNCYSVGKKNREKESKEIKGIKAYKNFLKNKGNLNG